jgi:hypothetical protein
MLELLIHAGIAMVFGWHLPQPAYVAAFFDSELWAKIKVAIHWPTK